MVAIAVFVVNLCRICGRQLVRVVKMEKGHVLVTVYMGVTVKAHSLAITTFS